VERSGAAAAPIIGGTASTREQDAVVLLAVVGPSRASFCTGTLIANNLVLTARHCVAKMSPGSADCEEGGAASPLASRVTGEIEPRTLRVFTAPPSPDAAAFTRPAARARAPFIRRVTCCAPQISPSWCSIEA
jgi:hypothetical protein